MRVLVIRGTGYIGSQTAKVLARAGEPQHSSLDEIIATAWQWHTSQTRVSAAQVNRDVYGGTAPRGAAD
jgi:UDP-glucose 4-epimerase